MNARLWACRNVTRVQASANAGRSVRLSASFGQRFFGVWARGARVLACAAGDGGHGLRGICLQRFGLRMVGDGDLAGSQVADGLFRADRTGDLDSPPCAAPSPTISGSRGG